MNKSFKESAAKLDMVLEPTSARSSKHSHAENDSLASNSARSLMDGPLSATITAGEEALGDPSQQSLEGQSSLERIEKLAMDRPSEARVKL